MGKVINTKILQALEECLAMYWQRKGFYSFELRAVSFTYENGREITRKLAEFDLREDISLVFRTQLEVCNRIVQMQPSKLWQVNTPELEKALESAWMDGTLSKPVNVLYSEWKGLEITQ